MDDPMLWAGIWLAVAITFAAAEIMIAGTFFLLPFAAGAAAASVVSLFKAPLVLSWAVFIVVSTVAFFALRPFAKRLASNHQDTKGVGANRLIGSSASVISTIPGDPSKTGRIKIGREEWVANAEGIAVPEGAEVTVIEVRGTQAIVQPR